MKQISRFAAILTLLGLAGAGWAQDYPAKNVHLLVGFAAGGPTDVLARLVGQKLSEKWQQPVVVENKTGASGTIQLDALAKSAPDGYTLGILNLNHVIAGEMLKKLSFSIQKDFAPIIAIARQGNVLVIHPDIPAKNAAELIAYLKGRPGQVNYASGGNGSPAHVAGELFKLMAGVDMVHVPYKGAAAAVQALLAGEVDLMFEVSVGVLAHIKAAKLRPLLVTGAKPVDALPGVPPFDSIFPGVGIEAWHGVFAPAATPPALLQQAAADLRTAVLSPEVSARLKELGFQPTGLHYPRFQEVVARDLERWGKVIRDNNIRAD